MFGFIESFKWLLTIEANDGGSLLFSGKIYLKA
jgi:hypothetical protein